MFNTIDDDEWFELSLALNSTMHQLPPGSRIVESREIPPFRAAITASGMEIPGVRTVPLAQRPTARNGAVDAAIELALGHHNEVERGVTIAVTQTDAGDLVAVAVAGLAGERCSFTSFDLRPGTHSIDLGFDVLQLLPGWAMPSIPSAPPSASNLSSAA